MKYFSHLLLLFLLPLSLSAAPEMETRLKAVSRITSITPLSNTVGYHEKYVVTFTQPLDHRHPSRGNFTQRVIVMHRGMDRPTIIVTEGYQAGYALQPNYQEELSRLYRTNVIFVEHRFFDQSTPHPCQWKYLTEENAMSDLHDITTTFKSIYQGKWISTGVSKGGQTCMEYRAFFPGDVDISVPYVAPLCFGVEDGRHEPFFHRVGTAVDRGRILNFQTEVLKRKARLMPDFKAYCEGKHYKFNIPVEDVFDYCVLEFSFSIWQWGTSTLTLPLPGASDKTLLDMLIATVNPSYFTTTEDTVFFYQACRELGYYGYETTPFRPWLSIKSAKGYAKRVMLPDSLQGVRYHKALSRRVRKFLIDNDPQMLFIYGSVDPWTSAGVTWLKGKQNIHVFIQPGGSHRSRISNMPANIEHQILDILSRWIGEQPSLGKQTSYVKPTGLGFGTGHQLTTVNC